MWTREWRNCDTSIMRIRIAKVLTPNDLGRTGSHQTGIHVPKTSGLLKRLPTLDPTKRNPSVIVRFSCEQLGRELDIRFIYYNSRLHPPGNRNEYRITRLSPLFKGLRPDPGDMLWFEFSSSAEGEERSLTVERNSAPNEESDDPRWVIEEIPFD